MTVAVVAVAAAAAMAVILAMVAATVAAVTAVAYVFVRVKPQAVPVFHTASSVLASHCRSHLLTRIIKSHRKAGSIFQLSANLRSI